MNSKVSDSRFFVAAKKPEVLVIKVECRGVQREAAANSCTAEH